MTSKIRKSQIKTEEFIIPSADALWTSEEVSASQLAIANKIASSIAGAAGAMVYQGAWTSVPAAGVGVKKGWVYVATAATTIATVNVEIGDMLIANTDTPDPSDAADWTIVQANIDDAYVWAKVKAMLVQGSYITLTKNDATKTITFSVTPPAVSGGAAAEGYYVSGISISGNTITATKSALPTMFSYGNFCKEVPSGDTDGVNMVFNATNTIGFLIGLFRNGVKYDDAEITLAADLKKLTLSSSVPAPTVGDVVEVIYVKHD